MVFCTAVGCKNETNTKGKGGKKLSFFKFPKDERREAWVKAVSRKNWTPNEYSQLCSEHFSSDQVISLVSGLRLRDKAIPNIFSTQPAKSKTNSKLGGTSKQKVLKEEVQTPKSSAEPKEPCTMSAPISPSCCVPKCTSKEALMFSVPKDADLRRHWESVIGSIDGRALTENDFVCEAHFMKSMVQVVYEKQEDDVFRGVKKLVDEAVPTIFLNTNTISGSSPDTAPENLPLSPSAQASKESENLPSTSSQESKKTAYKGKRPLKRNCCVPNCTSVESPSNTFHQFPVQAGRCKTWLNLLNMSDFHPNKMTRVCSKHFASSSFSSSGELRADAVPKLYSSSYKKLQQESDPDSLLSEAQKTAAWLQSVKQKREERKHKRVMGPGPLSYRKKMKVHNPWGVKDCEVVISGKERELADAALPRWKEYEQRMGRCLDVPLPIVEIKEEPVDVMDLTVDDLSQITALPPSPVKPLKPILPKSDTSPMAVPPLITANNLVFQTTLRSASEVKSVQNQPLPPSTIYRVIIPTSVQGHTIEPSSILEQLKDKISAMHQEKIKKNAAAWSSPQIVRLPTPAASTSAASTPRPASQPKPLKLPLSATSKTIGKAAVVKSNNLAMKDTPLVGEHAYASKPNQSSWPILLQTPIMSPVAAPATSATSSSSTTPAASTSSTASVPPISSATQLTSQTLTPLSDLGISSYGSIAPPVAYPPIKIGKINGPKKPPAPKKVKDVPLCVTTFAPEGTLKVVPNMTTTGPGVGSVMTFRMLSVGTQTNLMSGNLLPIKQANEMRKANEKYKSKAKILKQSLRRTTNRLQKATKELEEYKCLKSLIAEQEKGRENVIVIEATDRCSCFSKRREHEDLEDILGSAVNRRVPPPAESKATVIENEKLMKRIGIVKKKLKQKEITRVVVFQTEELLPMF